MAVDAEGLVRWGLCFAHREVWRSLSVLARSRPWNVFASVTLSLIGERYTIPMVEELSVCRPTPIGFGVCTGSLGVWGKGAVEADVCIPLFMVGEALSQACAGRVRAAGLDDFRAVESKLRLRFFTGPDNGDVS